jgi:hypothetical protein
MTRGGRRRRWVTRDHAPVWCPGGRWGPRRTRVTECRAILRAEEVYTALLEHNAAGVRAGARGTATYQLEGRGDVTASWEIRQNAVWRRGRVFLSCPRCCQRCTRLYLPLAHSWLACRRCWGLTYASRTLQNYKDSLWGRGDFARVFGTSQRDWAYQMTDDSRRERRRKAYDRWEVRRPYPAAASSQDPTG